MEIIKLKDLSEQLVTPAYVFSSAEFAERATLVKEAFGDQIGLCFSIKANPFLLQQLPDVFDKIEVCSPGELTICEKTGMDMSKVIFSGVNKTHKDVSRAMDDSVGVFTAESMLHVKLINDCAVERNRKVPVLLRLTGGSQFGMDEQEISSVIGNRDIYGGIEIVGLHYFTGTQKKKSTVIEKELRYIEQFAQQIQSTHNFRLQKIEYGTGLAVDYFAENADDLEKERLYAIAPLLRDLAQRYELTVEMGRFFAAPCGYYFTKVIDTKTNCGVHYAILDGGLNQLKYDGQLQGMQIPMIRHLVNRDNSGCEAEKWTLCGSLCTTADVLARNVELKDLQIGDILVFERTGAYSAMEGMSIFLSREIPQIAMLSHEKGLQVVRQQIHSDIFNTPYGLG